MTQSRLSLIPYAQHLAPIFKSINVEWISSMFKLEPLDLKILDHPESEIISKGGCIYFVEIEGMGIVGTGGLLKTGHGEFELTKMGVLEKARGHKAGEYLLTQLIKKAQDLGATNLYLLTNKKCEAAIHLYEKHGFQHDNEIMARFGTEYERGNVAMRFKPKN